MIPQTTRKRKRARTPRTGTCVVRSLRGGLGAVRVEAQRHSRLQAHLACAARCRGSEIVDEFHRTSSEVLGRVPGFIRVYSCSIPNQGSSLSLVTGWKQEQAATHRNTKHARNTLAASTSVPACVRILVQSCMQANLHEDVGLGAKGSSTLDDVQQAPRSGNISDQAPSDLYMSMVSAQALDQMLGPLALRADSRWRGLSVQSKRPGTHPALEPTPQPQPPAHNHQKRHHRSLPEPDISLVAGDARVLFLAGLSSQAFSAGGSRL